MKKAITNRFVVIPVMIALLLTMVFAPLQQTAQAKAIDSQLKSKYLAWLDRHGYERPDDSINIEYVDIDANGVPEMLWSHYALGHVVLTYDKKKEKVIKLKEMGGGGGGYAYYSKKKHTISLSGSSTGHETMIIYKVLGTKLKKIKVFKALRGEIKKDGHYIHVWEYRINGKKVTQKQYNKQHKNAVKGYIQVTPV